MEKISFLLLFVLHASLLRTQTLDMPPIPQNVLLSEYDLEGQSELPLEYSLKPYCPLPNQATIASVGQAVGYGAMTMTYALQNRWTDTKHITENAFSGLFIPQVASGDACKAISFKMGFEALQQKGNLFFKDFDKRYTCGKIPQSIDYQKAVHHKIKLCINLLQPSATPTIRKATLQKCLLKGKPVVVGLLLPNDFSQYRGQTPYYHSAQAIGMAHAMVIVGYDEFGFELMNSWGTDWGDKGFFKIKYEDFNLYCKEAYLLDFDFQGITPSLVAQTLMGKLEFRTLETGSMRPSPLRFHPKKYYEKVQKLDSGQSFQLMLRTLQSNTFIYVFEYNAAQTITVHFPKNHLSKQEATFEFIETAAVPYDNSYLILPKRKNTFKKGDGTSYLFVLYARREWAEADLKRRLNLLEGANEAILERFQQVFGDVLAESVQYDPTQAAFTAQATPKVIPLILTF
jgi:hypothetical protein